MKRLRTFDGVYTPTVLTILGVIMYLRLGWVVGNAGLLGALIIILLAHVITITTTLSMSSMLSNIKIEAGGAYAIVSRSLGLEMGGAVGIPLYFSQSISVAFYITGFSELWVTFFPNHSMALVSGSTWLVLTVISIISAQFAFRIQYVVLAAVGLSLVSFAASGTTLNTGGITLLGDYAQGSFWQTFAIFFPAVTGILAGASMSGELDNPRRNIIRGTILAVLTGFAVYLVMAVQFSRQAPVDLLLSDNTVILRLAWSKPLIVAGIMGAVLSSALSTLVSAPRTMAALAEHRSLPLAGILGKKSKNGEPRYAIVLSSLFSLLVLLTGNLNSLAELLTLFFLTTYGMINLAVFVEQAIGIISFRPRISFSIFVPIIGMIGCFLAMLLINRGFALVTFFVILCIYYVLSKRKLVSPWGDVRGGVFTAVTEWAAQKAMSMPYHPRLWKPSLIIPVESPEDFRRVSRFVQGLIFPSGRIYYLSINENGDTGPQEEKSIDETLLSLKEANLFAQKVLIHGGVYHQEIKIVLQSLLSTFLPPNTAFFTISSITEKQQRFKNIIESIRPLKIGLMCLYLHPKYGMGQEKRIHLWLRDKSPNTNLAVLSALQLMRNWHAQLVLLRMVTEDAAIEPARQDLMTFLEDARLPVNTRIEVRAGKFQEIIHQLPADLNIIGMPTRFEQIPELIQDIPTSILFVGDSGLENALA